MDEICRQGCLATELLSSNKLCEASPALQNNFKRGRHVTGGSPETSFCLLLPMGLLLVTSAVSSRLPCMCTTDSCC